MAKIEFKPGTMLNPVPAVMVSCGDETEQNIITIAWTGIVNTDPPMTYISVRKERHSHDIIARTGESPVNLECKVLDVREFPTHDMFLAEIIGVSVEESLMDEKGRLRLEDAGLIAYSHGSYVALQHKELGTFGYSVMKPKTRRRIAAQKRQDNHARKAKQGDREGKNGKRPEAPVRGQASRRNSSGRKKSHSPAKKIR